jgi:hypothetical protein
MFFSHFDPNDSGSINYGEFVWAFYNKKQLIHKWKKVSSTLTPKQLLAKFHEADTNGDGVLSLREFRRFLKFMLQMDMTDDDIELLFDRFDVDKDGTLDLEEFTEFMEKELALENNEEEKLKLPINKSNNNEKVEIQTKRIYKAPAKHHHDDSPPPQYHDNNAIKSHDMLNKTTNGRIQGGNIQKTSNIRPKSATVIGTYKTVHSSTNSSGTRPKSANATTTKSNTIANNDIRISNNINDKIVDNDLEEIDDNNNQIANNNKSLLTSSIDSNNSLLWVNDILQKQSLIESKLGHRYY